MPILVSGVVVVRHEDDEVLPRRLLLAGLVPELLLELVQRLVQLVLRHLWGRERGNRNHFVFRLILNFPPQQNEVHQIPGYVIRLAFSLQEALGESRRTSQSI